MCARRLDVQTYKTKAIQKINKKRGSTVQRTATPQTSSCCTALAFVRCCVVSSLVSTYLNFRLRPRMKNEPCLYQDAHSKQSMVVEMDSHTLWGINSGLNYKDIYSLRHACMHAATVRLFTAIIDKKRFKYMLNWYAKLKLVGATSAQNYIVSHIRWFLPSISIANCLTRLLGAANWVNGLNDFTFWAINKCLLWVSSNSPENSIPLDSTGGCFKKYGTVPSLVLC